MFQRARLPNALASPTSTTRGRVQPLTDSTNLTWTRSRLEKERNDWWDTQVTGSQEVWGAIRLAAQSLQLGKLRDAQQWLETMECTCPTGCLWKGVYDSTGVMYKVPDWLIVEPEGLVAEGAEDDAAGESAGAAAALDGAPEVDDEEDDEPVVVRARISLTGRDVVLKLQRKWTVASILDKIKKEAEVRLCHVQWVKSGPVLPAQDLSILKSVTNNVQLDVSSNIRLVYGGRVYQEHETLESHPFWDYANDYVVNALVLE
jgi:hypothetical protein